MTTLHVSVIYEYVDGLRRAGHHIISVDVAGAGELADYRSVVWEVR